MQAILLVGGRGTRLQPLTDTRPKPMLPIVDRPFLEHQLEHLSSYGITDVTFACGFMPQAIVAHFGDGERLGMRLSYVVEPEPLGTGGAIAFAANSNEPAPVLVCNGDVLTRLDLSGFIQNHRHSKAQATIALTPVDEPTRYGLVRCGPDGQVTAFVEKPEPHEVDTNLINAGMYVLEPEVVSSIPQGQGGSIERDIFPSLVGHGLFASASDAYWIDIGTAASYLQANMDTLQARGEGAFVGEGAQVRDGAEVGPDVVVSAGCVIESGAQVRGSVLLEGVVVKAGATVTDSIVGEGAVIGAGASVTAGTVVAPGALR